MEPGKRVDSAENSNNVWNLFSLQGKVALVTGGASGLGYDMALALAEAWADVVITSRFFEKAKESADTIHRETGQRALPLKLDVTQEREVEQAIDKILLEFRRLDILVNNAGNVKASTPDSARLENRKLADWQDVIDVNLTGTFLCVKHAVAKYMMKAKAGRIINLGSVAGMVGKDRRVYEGTQMGGITMDYSAAKGGVINFTRDLAAYLAPYDILANCISPGGFWRRQDPEFVKAYNKTAMLDRMGQEGKDLKGAVVFLASEASSYITGHNLVVDGGHTAW